MTTLVQQLGGPTWALVLRALLAAFFTFLAIKNLTGDAAMAADFERWGYPSWFRTATALVQLAGGLALLIPQWVTPAALLLACVLLGAVATHLLNDPPLTALSPAICAALVGTVLWSQRGRG